jgi:hypothetical protein
VPGKLFLDAVQQKGLFISIERKARSKNNSRLDNTKVSSVCWHIQTMSCLRRGALVQDATVLLWRPGLSSEAKHSGSRAIATGHCVASEAVGILQITN